MTTHHTTLVQRCRTTNSLLADDIEREFRRLENERDDARFSLQKMLATYWGSGDGHPAPEFIQRAAKLCGYPLAE